MNCQDLKNQMMDAALDELGKAERLQAEEHARECAQCGALLKNWRHMSDLLKRGWPDEELPASLVLTPTSVPARANFWSWWLAAPRGVSATAVATLAVLLLFTTLSLSKFELRYDPHQLQISFGRRAASGWLPPAAGTVSTAPVSLEAAQIEKFVTEKYAALSASDRAQYAALLERLSAQMNAQRVSDLQKISVAFDQVKTVVWKDLQRNSALVQVAAQRLETLNKN